MPLVDACMYEAALFGDITFSEDGKEGTSAFLEKAPADLEGPLEWRMKNEELRKPRLIGGFSFNFDSQVQLLAAMILDHPARSILSYTSEQNGLHP